MLLTTTIPLYSQSFSSCNTSDTMSTLTLPSLLGGVGTQTKVSGGSNSLTSLSIVLSSEILGSTTYCSAVEKPALTALPTKPLPIMPSLNCLSILVFSVCIALYVLYYAIVIYD